MDALVAIGLEDDADIQLDRAAIALAAADRVRPDTDWACDLLDDLAARLAAQAGRSLAAERAAALRRLLAAEAGFTGARTDYGAPEHADFLHVLERRRGLPIALAILWVASARRIGWQAEVLGVPGHVLVEVAGAGAAVVVDPFGDGRALSDGEVRFIAARGLGESAAVEPAHVAPLSNRATLVRLLLNPATRAERAGDAARALTLYRRMTLVAPRMPALWWERARLERRAGDVAAARRSLAAMLETTRDPALIGRIRAAVDALTR